MYVVAFDTDAREPFCELCRVAFPRSFTGTWKIYAFTNDDPDHHTAICEACAATVPHERVKRAGEN